MESVSRTAVPAAHSWTMAVLLALSGSVVFITSYPPWNVGVVAGWVTLVPLMVAAAGAPPMRAALLGWLFGLAAYAGVFAWLFAVPGFRWYHFLLLDAYLALYPALWCMVLARFAHGSVLAQVGLACAWVLTDYARAHAGFLALPWITLAQSQVDNIPLLQMASFFGEPAVTFLVVLGNLAIWNLLRGGGARVSAMCAVPALGAMIFGIYVLSNSRVDSNPHILAAAFGTEFPAQHAPPPDLKARLDAELAFLEHSIPVGVEIVVLPESALVNPRLFPTQVGKLQRLAKQNQTALVVGVAEATKFDNPTVDVQPSGPTLRSGAWLITPESDVPQHYEKSLLVPFAEEVPLKQWLTWPTWLIQPIPEVARGPAPRSYPLQGGVRVGIMICWESLFAEHARTLVADDATVLLILANEGWFGTTAAGAQHNLTARIRAVETHRSVVVASNMGPSLVIDPFGRVIAQSSSDSEMHLAMATAPLFIEKSLYSRMGDIFAVGCGLFLLTLAFGSRLNAYRVRD